MSFDSPRYLLFLPTVCALHWLLPARLRWVLLLEASYVFYASWDAPLSLLILAVTAAAYFSALLLERSASPRVRKCCLTAALMLPLGLLGYFKYADLLGRTVSAITGGTWNALNVVLPVGVSFYTFQAISYVVDVYRGKMKAERHFGYFALYIAFFPQLVAGPIERAGALLPQLKAQRRLTRGDITSGLRLLASGYFRKLVIADLIAPFVDAVYGAALPDGSAVLCATLLFAVQIYCDFSGYSEIALGSARLLGVRLMRNFDRPYGAANIREFWRRWHISLTVWLTDYVYIPMGGSRRGLARQLAATLTVFALCGLWHGAEWSFVMWGLLHALTMAAYTLLHRRFRGGGMGERALTLMAVCFAWLFFRAENLPHALLLLRQLLSPWHVSAGLELLMSAAPFHARLPVLLWLLAGMLAMLRRLPLLTEEGHSVSDPAWAALLLSIVIAALIRISAGMTNTFIYFQF